MNEEDKNLLFKQLNSAGKLEFPSFQYPSIPKEGLIISKEKTRIKFKNGEVYDKITKILTLNNGETFKGEINKGEKYTLIKGEYKWPSGQIYNGEFNDNNKKTNGTIIYQNGWTYKGKFKDEKFDGEGEFIWNDKEFIKGQFKNGDINGEAILKKENHFIKGNFVDSKSEGKIEEFKIDFNNHSFVFPEFNLKNGEIEEDRLVLTKDNNRIILNNKLCREIKIVKDKTKIKINDDELKLLNKLFELIKEIIPKYELPSIPDEGLIEIKEEYIGPFKKFKNGIIGNFEEDNVDQNLNLSNGEKLIEGRLNNDNCGKYWIEEGKYIWPNGQEYIGEFNQNNKFESEDAELKINNEWEYKGGFKNGKINGFGIFKWNNGNTLSGYFLDGNFNGEISIKWENIIINGFLSNSLINEFEAKIDENNYRIRILDKSNNVDNILTIEKNENEYFIINAFLEKDKIILNEYNNIDKNEKQYFMNCLNTIIEIPMFETTSINEDGLIVQNNVDDENEIIFENGIIYNKEKKLLTLPNKETFKGELKKSSNKYFLEEGEYEWPDGQKYIGKFNENNFEGNEDAEIIYKDWTYKGGFKSGKPFGKGDITWKDGNYIKGNFEKGKIFGETKIKMNDITFEGNYTSSIINGPINNLNTIIDNHFYQISNLSISKGSIDENLLDIKKDNEEEFKLELNQTNKLILPPELYKIFEYNEEDLLLIFKSLSKIRKINLPYFSSPSIQAKKEIFKDKNNNIEKVVFSNNEFFKGKSKIESDKFILIDGEYEWPSGQKYKGKFSENMFDSDKGELNYKNEWKYKGGFKNGYIEGKGIFEKDKGISIEANFEKNIPKSDIKIKDINNDNFYFEGNNLDSIDKLYTKYFYTDIQNHFYELFEFKMSNKNITFKKDGIAFNIEITDELKLKIIESLIIKFKPKKPKFFYNEPFKEEVSNENKIKRLKIQDKIHSKQLSSLSIYCNHLLRQKKKITGKLGKMTGVNISQNLNLNEIIYKIKEKKLISEEDKKILKSSVNNFQKNKNSSQDKNFNEIEKNEILKGCNNQMLKEMKNELNLINNDVITLRKERDYIEKNKKNKNKKFNDIIYYYNLIDNDYNELNKEKNIIDNDTNIIEQNIKNIIEKNIYLKNMLNNSKNNNKNNNNKIDKTIKELENKNNEIIKKIKTKEEMIKSFNEEKDQLMKRIKELEELIEEQK